MANNMKMAGMKIERGRNVGKIYSGLYNGKKLSNECFVCFVMTLCKL